MLTCKIICICTFVLIATHAVVIRDSDEEEINYRLPNHVKPLHYDINLNPHLTPGNSTFDGEVSIHIDILNKTKTLTLHTKKLIIAENATVLRSKAGLDFTPTTYNYDNRTELLSLDFEKDLSIGRYILYLKFIGVLVDDGKYGFYKGSYTNSTAEETVWFAGANFKATYARAAFPCWDEPALKATFKIAIKHDQNYRALSNMPISEVSEVDESDGKIWTHFEESPVMSTYLVSFLVSDFRAVGTKSNRSIFWSRSNLGFVSAVAEKAAIYLEQYTNSSIPVVKVDHVALPGLPDRSAESWGLITYKEDVLLYDTHVVYEYSVDKVRAIIENISYLMSYQWSGNAVTPSWWTNTWMNGGLAEYLKHIILNKEINDPRITNLMMVEMLNSVLLFDAYNLRPLNFDPNTPEEINSKFSSIEDRKAFLLFRMLSHCISNDVFHEGLIKYLNKHKYDVVEPEDLWGALQEVLDESTVPQKFNIQKIMNTWIGQKGYPLVTVTRDYETGLIKIRQEYFQPNENANSTDAANKKWWIPINFATHTNPDFSSTLPTHWLSPEDEELVIEGVDPHDWIIVNIQQTGFYRVNYDKLNWLKIADYMFTENYEKIHVLNRAQIINDAIFLMLSNKIHPHDFMEITKYLQNETDVSAWYPMLKFLNNIKTYSFVCNEGGPMLKSYAHDLMNNLIETVGITENVDDDSFALVARNVILEEACAFNHPICLRQANTELMRYLKVIDHLKNTNRLHDTPFFKKKWVLCNGIKQANETIWEKVLKQQESNRLLLTSCFAYSKKLFSTEKFLNSMLECNDSDSEVIWKEEIYHFMYSVLSADFPLYVNTMLNFTINHWDKLTMFDNYMYLLSDLSTNVASKEQVEEVKTSLINVGIEIPQIFLEFQEKSIESAEKIMNKIRVWLKLRNKPHTESEVIDLFHRQCKQPL